MRLQPLYNIFCGIVRINSKITGYLIPSLFMDICVFWAVSVLYMIYRTYILIANKRVNGEYKA